MPLWFNSGFNWRAVHLLCENMNPLLPLTHTAIADCRDHVNQFPGADPAILAYLTRHVNGLMCAEIERVVTRLIRERLGKGCSDTATSSFLQSLGRSSVRNATVSEIRNTIKLLGSQYQEKFNHLLEQTIGQEGIEKLGIAVGKRNENAHENPPDITFGELEDAFSTATKVVDAVRLTLET